jgi:NADH dehydrogenase
VWAAGIRAPEFLGALGLPTNKGGQIEVDAHLRVRGVPGVYALGDCAACIDGEGKPVPPRAQAAHQQADYLLKMFLHGLGAASRRQTVCVPRLRLAGLDRHQTTVGSLMGSLSGASWFVEGLMARMMYLSLHLMHHQAVLGTMRTGCWRWRGS